MTKIQRSMMFTGLLMFFIVLSAEASGTEDGWLQDPVTGEKRWAVWEAVSNSEAGRLRPQLIGDSKEFEPDARLFKAHLYSGEAAPEAGQPPLIELFEIRSADNKTHRVRWSNLVSREVKWIEKRVES